MDAAETYESSLTETMEVMGERILKVEMLLRSGAPDGEVLFAIALARDLREGLARARYDRETVAAVRDAGIDRGWGRGFARGHAAGRVAGYREGLDAGAGRQGGGKVIALHPPRAVNA